MQYNLLNPQLVTSEDVDLNRNGAVKSEEKREDGLSAYLKETVEW